MTTSAIPLPTFSSAPSVPSSPDANKLIEAIRDQTQGVPTNLVFVLDIVSVRFGGYFTPQIKRQIQRFPFLQMLTLNDCDIKSLENFPHLPGLIRLDLVFNQISGETLHHIRGSRHLQTLMLGANNIQKFQEVETLRNMKQLLQLDLINNPIYREPGYRQKIFNLFPSLTVLDTLDRSGKDAYHSSSMATAASRVPDALFDKSVHVPFVPPPAPVVATVSSVSHSISRSSSRSGLVASTSKVIIKSSKAKAPVVKAKGGKSGKVGKLAKVGIKSSRSLSSKAGLVFPVGRLKRKLKQSTFGTRISKNGAVYLAAVLEYLTADLIQGVGIIAKNDKKARIMPQHIKNYLKQDEEVFKYLKGITLSMNSE